MEISPWPSLLVAHTGISFLILFFFSVQILAEEAHSLDAFDANAAKAALDEATAAANAAGDDAAKAEAQIAVEVADALVKALA